MQKAINISKKIIKEFDKDWMQELEDNNLHSTFGPIYSMPNIDIEDKNRIICFIIYAYDNESLWLDLKSDRLFNKQKILDSLGANMKLPIFEKVIWVNDDIVGMCIFNYLEQLKTHKWKDVFDLLDLSAKIRKFATEETEAEIITQKFDKENEIKTTKSDVDIDVLVKVYKGKSDLMDQSIAKRAKADEIMDQIRKDFVTTDSATQSDFNFMMSDTAKKRNILSWREFIRDNNERKKVAAI